MGHTHLDISSCQNIHEPDAFVVTHEPEVRGITRDLLSDMRWLRSVGSIKLQVSFAEYRLFYRALLQKRPLSLSILLTEATP